jgi:hypothetical protein
VVVVACIVSHVYLGHGVVQAEPLELPCGLVVEGGSQGGGTLLGGVQIGLVT